MTIRIGIYLLLIVVGLVVLAWPEQDDLMMVQFSKTHGPSALDLIGLALIFAGYIPLIIPVVSNFALIQKLAGKMFSTILAAIAVICLMLIVVALMVENETLLWMMVAITTLAQVVLIYFALQKTV